MEAAKEVHKIKCRVCYHISATEHEQFIPTMQYTKVVVENSRDARFHLQGDKLSRKTQPCLRTRTWGDMRSIQAKMVSPNLWVIQVT